MSVSISSDLFRRLGETRVLELLMQFPHAQEIIETHQDHAVFISMRAFNTRVERSDATICAGLRVGYFEPLHTIIVFSESFRQRVATLRTTSR